MRDDTRWRMSDTAVAACLAAIPLLLHLLTSTRYGYFRDEFYYIACSEHLVHWSLLLLCFCIPCSFVDTAVYHVHRGRLPTFSSRSLRYPRDTW
jgi:hypothetical protein